MNKTAKPFYHGSSVKISDGFIRRHVQETNNHEQTVNAVFFTSDRDYAILFGIRMCLRAGYTAVSRNPHAIFFEKLSSRNLNPTVWLYTAHESDDAPFVPDRGTRTEYYCESDVKIAKSESLDIATEIERMGCKIYVMDKEIDKTLPQSEQDAQWRHAMDNKQYHLVNIREILSQSAAHKFTSGKTKIQHKKDTAIKTTYNITTNTKD